MKTACREEWSVFHKCLFLLASLVLLVGTGAPVGIKAAPVTPSEAKAAVQTFLIRRFPATNAAEARLTTLTGSSRFAPRELAVLQRSNAVIGYVAPLQPGGYVLLRADDQAPPVKLYSDSGSFSNLPPQFLRVIGLELAEELAQLQILRQRNVALNPKHARQWSALKAPTGQLQELESFETSAAGTTLLSTTWNQNDPYNYYCPAVSGGSGSRAYAGCTACALAQILKFHHQPAQVSSNHTYLDSWGICTGTHSFSDASLEAYSWSNMPPSLSASSALVQKQAIGQLMYHAAVALDSDFEAGNTSALPNNIPSVLSTFFSYASGPFDYRGTSSSSEWYSRLASDLDANQPVFYAMWQADWSDGHAVVCDGYRNGNEIHLNLGWSGAGNAWYNLDKVSVGGYTWTVHAAIFGITPPLWAPRFQAAEFRNRTNLWLQLRALPNAACTLQVSTNLVNWVPFMTQTIGPSGLWEIIDPDASCYPRRYYRATLSAAP